MSNQGLIEGLRLHSTALEHTNRKATAKIVAKAADALEAQALELARLSAAPASDCGADERAAFKQAMNKINKTVGQWLNGKYSNPYAQAAWEGWQACAALSPKGGGVVQVCKLGSHGSAYDTPEVCRAFTYAEQPNNILALRLGRALSNAPQAGGDFIDHGLGLLKTLQQEGFGVFQIDEANRQDQQRGSE